MEKKEGKTLSFLLIGGGLIGGGLFLGSYLKRKKEELKEALPTPITGIGNLPAEQLQEELGGISMTPSQFWQYIKMAYDQKMKINTVQDFLDFLLKIKVIDPSIYNTAKERIQYDKPKTVKTISLDALLSRMEKEQKTIVFKYPLELPAKIFFTPIRQYKAGKKIITISVKDMYGKIIKKVNVDIEAIKTLSPLRIGYTYKGKGIVDEALKDRAVLELVISEILFPPVKKFYRLLTKEGGTNT